MKISSDKVVTMNYTLTDNTGSLIDSSKEREPFSYIHGTGTIIPRLEKELEGMSTGESVNVNITAEEGYGARDESLMQDLPMERFSDVDDLKIGMQFQVEDGSDSYVFTVVNIEGENVTIDWNHPLAGIDLNFAIDVLEVRDATEEELDHCNVHADDE